MANKSEKLPSNEEIIEELTKDLENSCIKKDDASIHSENSHGESNNTDNFPEDTFDDVESKFEDETNVHITEVPQDFVDENYLKEREERLSPEKKEELKEEAENLKTKGNEQFKDNQYENAIITYTQAINTCPLAYNKERSILYANRAAAKAKHLSEKDSAIADCTKAIELNPDYVKAYVRRAQLYETTEKLDEALEDYKKILTFNPAHTEANYAVRRLPPLIQERNEKLKEEVLGKLKDLGNMVLKPFGLSTNNFELQKNPDSDGYSVKFHQNPS